MYVIIYYVIISFDFFFIFGDFSSQKTLYVLAVYFLVFLFCLSFLRWRVGTDWDSYYEIYLHPELYANMETGFMMINSIGKNYFESYTVTLFI